MMGQMFSTLNRREEEGKRRGGKGEKKRGKARGKQGLPFSLVYTLYSLVSIKLKYGRKPSVCARFSFRCCCVRYFIA